MEGGATGYLVGVVGVRAVRELDAGVRAGQLPAAGDPGNGGAFVEEVDGAEVLHPFLHDQPHAQHLSFVVVGDQQGRQNLDDGVGVLFLWICQQRTPTES